MPEFYIKICPEKKFSPIFFEGGTYPPPPSPVSYAYGGQKDTETRLYALTHNTEW